MSSPGTPSRATARDLRQRDDATATANIPVVPDDDRMAAALGTARTERPKGGGVLGAGNAPITRGSLADAPGGLPPRPGEAASVNGPSGGGSGSAGSTPSVRRPGKGVPRPARRAQLTLRRFNIWSVFKFSCLLAIALWLVWMIAIGVLYGVVDASGIISSINDAVTTINGEGSNAPIQPGQVLGIAAIVGVVNMVLFIVLSSVFAVIYNLVADFVGGIEVTLSERE